jgi:Fructose-bisphosphate aldolase class-II
MRCCSSLRASFLTAPPSTATACRRPTSTTPNRSGRSWQLRARRRSLRILQGSAGARKYAGEPFLRHLVAAAVEAYPALPIVMHQDYGAPRDVCMGAIRSGFTSVMMDGSLKDDAKTPADYLSPQHALKKWCVETMVS